MGKKYTIYYVLGKIELFASSRQEAIKRALQIRTIYGFINNNITHIKREV